MKNAANGLRHYVWILRKGPLEESEEKTQLGYVRRELGGLGKDPPGHYHLAPLIKCGLTLSS